MRTLRQQQALALREANRRHDRALAEHIQARTATPPTTPPTTLTIDLRSRSLALAASRGETSCSWAAHTRAETLNPVTGALRTLALEIDSATRAGVRYAVRYDAASDDAMCCCRAAQMGQACWHRGLAVLKGRSVAACYTPTGRAAAAREARWQMRMEANAEALAPSL